MTARYDLYYWPIPFRGHPIRFVLAHAGVDWVEHDYDEVAALTDKPLNQRPYPFFAPPLLRDRETGEWLSQMPAILMYLGRVHGLTASPDQSLRVICDLSDILLEITRYHGEKMWDAPSWRAFASDRLPKWMATHEALATSGGVTPSHGFMFGAGAPGLPDLAMSAVWHTMADRLPGLRTLLNAHAPAVEGLADRIAGLPRIAALRAKSETGQWRYCAGQIEQSLFKVLTRG